MESQKSGKIWRVLLVLLLTFPFFLLGNRSFAEGENVTIHKKDFSTAQTDIQNTGSAMPDFDSVPGLGGVTFTVYDVTAKFYEYRVGDAAAIPPVAGMTVAQAQAAILAEFAAVTKDTDWLTNLATKFGTAVESGTTGTNGDLNIYLSPTSGGKDAIYLIVETAQPETVTTVAAPMILNFPVYEYDSVNKVYTDVELDDIHLYPKNVSLSGGMEFTKTIVTSSGEHALLGAKFVIHRKGTYDTATGTFTTGTEFIKELDSNGHLVWTTVLAEAHPFITDTNGKFDTGAMELPKGDYYTTEIEVPAYSENNINYPVFPTNEVTNVPFTISETVTSVTLSGKNGTTTVDKETMPREDWTGDIDYQFNFEIGEPIKYEIDVLIPIGIADTFTKEGVVANRFAAFGFTDTYSPELEWLGEYKLFQGTTDLTTLGLFTLTPPSATVPNSYTVDFDVQKLGAYEGKMLTFKYELTLNEDAIPDAGYDNTVELNVTHLDTPYSKEDDGELVYTGGKRFLKLDATNDDPLAGAKFAVGRMNGADKEYMQQDATTLAITWVADIADATELESGADGTFAVIGLEYGDYFLTETVAPSDEYVKITTDIAFEVTRYSYNTVENVAVSPQEVPNKPKGFLPSTGGFGTIGFLLAGAIFVFSGLMWYLKTRKQASEE